MNLNQGGLWRRGLEPKPMLLRSILLRCVEEGQLVLPKP